MNLMYSQPTGLLALLTLLKCTLLTGNMIATQISKIEGELLDTRADFVSLQADIVGIRKELRQDRLDRDHFIRHLNQTFSEWRRGNTVRDSDASLTSNIRDSYSGDLWMLKSVQKGLAAEKALRMRLENKVNLLKQIVQERTVTAEVTETPVHGGLHQYNDTCQIPTVENGHVHIKKQWGQSSDVPSGSSFLITCNDTYMAYAGDFYSDKGRAIITCQGDKLLPGHPECKPLYRTWLRDCKTIFDAGQKVSGVYTIYPTYDSKGLSVRCDMDTDGGGWTVFQRRIDGSVDFNRDWQSYKQGFGNTNTEYWLGLDNIHKMTSRGPMELRVDFVGVMGTVYAKYKTFSVGDESSGFILNIGMYTGNAKDGLHTSNGSLFSTLDRDNDKSEDDNCAQLYAGAWWYNQYCSSSNLNGIFNGDLQGIRWTWWINHVSFVEMKIK